MFDTDIVPKYECRAYDTDHVRFECVLHLLQWLCDAKHVICSLISCDGSLRGHSGIVRARLERKYVVAARPRSNFVIYQSSAGER